MNDQTIQDLIAEVAAIRARLKAAEEKISGLIELNELTSKSVSQLTMHAYERDGPIFGIQNRHLPS